MLMVETGKTSLVYTVVVVSNELSLSVVFKKDNGGIERIPLQRRSALPDLKRIGVVEMKEKKRVSFIFIPPFTTHISLSLFENDDTHAHQTVFEN